MRIGIIGGGISGMVSALYLQRLPKIHQIHLYEQENWLGGRIHTVSKYHQGSKYDFDVGANLIDFLDEKVEQRWNKFMPASIKSGLTVFKQPFLLFENGKLRAGDYEKNRYYFEGGFQKMIQTLQSEIDVEKVNICLNSRVSSVIQENGRVEIRVGENKQNYDLVFLSCPASDIPSILKDIPQSIRGLCENVQHTTQMTIGFLASEKIPKFSFILFFNHLITFMCNNEEKYKQKSVYVQMSEQFTKKHQNTSDEEIGVILKKEVLPEQMRDWIEGRQICVYRWRRALVKGHSYNYEAKGRIMCVGDSTTKKSRVTGVVDETLKILTSIKQYSQN